MARTRTRISLEHVLRLLDARTGSYAEVSPPRAGLLRVGAYAAEGAGGLGITGLRVQLVADLLARTAELGGVQVLTVLAFPQDPPAEPGAFERGAEAMGIHPPAAFASSCQAQTSLGGPIDVHLVSYGADVKPGGSGLVVQVGLAHMGSGDPGEAPASVVSTGQEDDPLAVRLALMSFPYQQPADLTDGVLASARGMLSDWRHRVAEWAESPSRPIPAAMAERARTAFAGLDTGSAIASLRGLIRDAGVPAGAKFETFVYTDRILGLDLARDIGKLGG